MSSDFKIGGCPTCGRQSCVAGQCTGLPSAAEVDHSWAERLLEAIRAPTHKLNTDRTVAVATDYYWNEDMSTCPLGAKVQLLGIGGVASYGSYNGRDPFWVAWAPLPKRRKA